MCTNTKTTAGWNGWWPPSSCNTRIMNHTIERHRRLYGLLRDTGVSKYRHELVSSYSMGRTDNSAELTDLEIGELIRYLSQLPKQSQDPNRSTKTGVNDRGQKMRRRILSICYTIGWTVWDERLQKHRVDHPRLNAWLLKYGYLHKPLNRYTYAELGRLVSQFENLVPSSIAPTSNP